ncbi:DUF2335 domain-containing protein [Streptomyces sp. NPDC005070]
MAGSVGEVVEGAIEELTEASTEAIEEIHREIRREFRSGPLPDPSELLAYESALPGLADRIVHMTEVEQQHRHEINTWVVRQPYFLARTGQLCGLVAVLLMAAFAAYLASLGEAGWAVAVAAVDFVGVAGVFVTGQVASRRQDKALEASDDDEEDDETEEDE